ncbi:flagellar transcriptional regulator FlhD [Nitrosomonas sp.]|uniref:flagellar transcriptional regulator FlhD n=1 Tax=Nitrosomonas sp. TaxID=42353 RepID=UPI001D489AEB|nr:flagellar transcriptional regulator FlhD [Nitrosomonas sp.]MCB1948958.1 flagellar transcriptional regulator FlhD [Nitrosomonas sp.]MCP5243961.1 flagellar transcriptional regulator FlhD [Burkholderiales bacterium]MDR4513406.1 flagellar transcriptional regulator FlhD [Nitrosomonas sp.]
METKQLLDEIREINLSYLLLAQQLIREDKVAAMYRLGINQDVAELIEKLTTSQLLKMASSNSLLCRFRFNDTLIAELLSGNNRDDNSAVSQSHAAILMAGQPAEAIS